MLDKHLYGQKHFPLKWFPGCVFVFRWVIQELDDSLTREQAEGLLQAIRQIALRGGFTVDHRGAAG